MKYEQFLQTIFEWSGKIALNNQCVTPSELCPKLASHLPARSWQSAKPRHRSLQRRSHRVRFQSLLLRCHYWVRS